MPGSGISGTSAGRIVRADVEDVVLEEIVQDPSTSTRAIARRTEIGKSTVHDILKRYKFHPFHVTRVQTLQSRDYNSRLRFCRQMLEKMEEDPQFFNKILWSDESTLKRWLYEFTQSP